MTSRAASSVQRFSVGALRDDDYLRSCDSRCHSRRDEDEL